MSEPTDNQAVSPPTHKHNRDMFWLISVSVVVLVILLAIGIVPRIKGNKALAERTKQVKSTVPSVVVTKPKLVPDSGVSLPGNIAAIQETTINGRTTGYLRQLYVDIGTHVKKGQVVALVQAPDTDAQYLQSVAQTSQQRSVVTQSQATVAQQKAIVAQDQADVAKQRATVEQAQAQLTGAVAAYKQAQATEQGAEASLEHYQQALNVQNATLAQQQATLKLSEVTYERYKGLVEQGFDTQQDLDQAQATLKTSQAAVVSAEAAIKEAQADIVTAQKTLQSAQAAVNAAQANVSANEKNVKLNVAGLVSAEATVRSAAETVNADVATVKANQAGVESNQANQERYHVMQDFEKIHAPFDGVITSRTVDAGALIVGDSAAGATSNPSSAVVSDSGTTVASNGILGIARTDEVRIQVSVPQTFVPALRSVSNAQVTVREIPGKTFTGVVTLRSGALDTTSRTQQVEVHLKNPTGILVPGMYATVYIAPTHPAMTWQVPGTALIVDASGTRVGVVTAKKTVHLQPVVIGRDFGTTVEILSGLTGKEKLVNNPSDLLQEGDKVQITTAAANPRGRGGRGGAGGSGGGAEGGTGRRGGGAPSSDGSAPGTGAAPGAGIAPGAGGGSGARGGGSSQ